MITVTQIPESNIVEMEIDGGITAEEFDDALAKFQDAIDLHGSIRVLEIVRSMNMPPIPWSKFWDDLQFGFEHLSDISHAAVASDQTWISTYVKLLNPLFKAEFKAFTLAELNQARLWLQSAE